MQILAFIGLFLPLLISGMDFIDSQGLKCRILPELVTVFKESEKGKDLEEDIKQGRLVDLSGWGLSSLKGEYINKVLALAKDPAVLPEKKFEPDEVYLLDAANWLGIQQKEVLYHLANRVWSHLDKDEGWDVKKFRTIARSYLHSPRHILAALQQENSGITVKSLCKQVNGDYYFDFACKETWPYALGSLDGLQECLDYVGVEAFSKVTGILSGGHLTPMFIDLSSNELREFDIDSLEGKSRLRYEYSPHFYKIILAHNNIRKITASNSLYWPKGDQHIDLTDNPVSFIDDSLYQLAKLYRSHGCRLHINMPHHKLSLQEVALAKQQWYVAVNTLVDRYFKDHNPDKVGIVTGLLTLVAGAGADVALKTNGTAMLIGFGLGLVGCLSLNQKYLPLLAHRVATLTHPEIEKPQFSMETPFGKTWLKDDQKPQITLG